MPRLFFAIWPDAGAAHSLRALALELAARAGGRAMPPEKIHLTLAFLGEVGADRADALVDAAGEVREAPFAMAFDRVGSFRRARVAWVGTAEPPAPLLRLQAALDKALRARGFALEERAFTPHVTLVRRVERNVSRERIEAIAWRAQEMALVRSDPGSGAYSTMATWPLKRARTGGA